MSTRFQREKFLPTAKRQSLDYGCQCPARHATYTRYAQLQGGALPRTPPSAQSLSKGSRGGPRTTVMPLLSNLLWRANAHMRLANFETPYTPMPENCAVRCCQSKSS